MKTGPARKKTSYRHRRVQFEALEPRAMLAGNVTIGLSNGALAVNGDSNSNSFTFGVNAQAHLIATGTNGTKINGKASVDVSALIGSASPTRIVANLGDGNDAASFSGGTKTNHASFPVDVTINGGKGIDTISVSNLEVAGDIKIQGGDGDDKLTVSNLTIYGTASVTTGAGNDQINITDSSVFASSDAGATGNATINSGIGNDTVTLSKTSTGNSYIQGNLVVKLDAGTDKLTISGSPIATNAVLYGGSGIDNINVSGLTVTGTSSAEGILYVFGNEGDDTISISNTTVQNRLSGNSFSYIAIEAGKGNDKVSISASRADAFYALLAEGNDSLKASGANSFVGLVHVEGEENRDTLTGKASLTAGTATIELLTLESIS